MMAPISYARAAGSTCGLLGSCHFPLAAATVADHAQGELEFLGQRNLRESHLLLVRWVAERMQLNHLTPRGLRRRCTKLCHVNDGELEQIQFLLGHVSMLTTERYLGCKWDLEKPVNDRVDSLFALTSVDLR